MTTDEIFVVFGSSGEYEDFREWPVMAYAGRDGADRHAAKLKLAAQEIHKIDELWTPSMKPRKVFREAYARLRALDPTREPKPEWQGGLAYQVSTVPFTKGESR